MIWELSHRAEKRALTLADRHYNRQKPGSLQFVPPGRCVVLVAPGAVWVTSWPFGEYVKHRWPGAWVNSLFRKEVAGRASAYILDAIAATRAIWPDVPERGIVTFVDAGKVLHRRDPGRCYLKSGFQRDGETKGGLLAFRLPPERMPDAEQPIGYMGSLLARWETGPR